jgi:DNA (cytosine-5)-methyltransferase 1
MYCFRGFAMEKLKIIDLFAGAGGLSNGFEQTESFEVVCAVELNQQALETYQENHKGKKIIYRQDITTFIPSEEKELSLIPKSELVVIGGPPCQGFSNANRQKNYLLSGNNKLVREFVRVIRELKPVAFLMENVKTMNSDKHKFFATTNKGKDTNHSFLKQYGVETISEQIVLASFRDNEVLVKRLKKLNELNCWPDPIFYTDEMLSKIRMIERSIKYQKNILTVKTTDSLLYEKMSYELIEFGKKYDLPFENSFKLLSDLSKKGNTNISLYNAADILALIELNRLLLFIAELSKENIDFKVIAEENLIGGLVLKAKVFSFNVVEYLLKIFDKELGYEVDNQVLTASNYGVPQQRKRFMIMGISRELIKDVQTVEFPEKLKSIDKPLTVFDALYSLKNYPPSYKVQENDLFDIPLEVRLKSGSKLEKYYTAGYKKIEVSNHVSTESRETSIKRFEQLDEGQNFHDLSDDLKSNYTDISRTQNTVYLRLKYLEPSRTVVNVRKSMWIHPEIDRALSIREAARLQSFPDFFVFKGTKDSQYQQIGNAVPPLMARAVAESMLKMLNRKINRDIEEDLFGKELVMK